LNEPHSELQAIAGLFFLFVIIGGSSNDQHVSFVGGPFLDECSLTRKRSVAMTQDRVTGAAANKWGQTTARGIASKIGAIMNGRTSNEATLDGKTVVIKCAAKATDSVGVTFMMLDRLDSIIGAFQLYDGSFELWSLSTEIFRQEMRDTRSKGSSAGKVGLVRRDFFEKSGRLLGRVTLDAAS
jgi:hypothetical protein